MSWEKLDTEEEKHFIAAVADKNEPVLFDPKLCYVMKHPLAFYEGYHLYRIVNNYMAPPFLMDFATNGEDHYYFDGSDTVFKKLNARHAISLNEHNVLDYLTLFISYVYERGNSFEFVREEDQSLPIHLIEGTIDSGLYKIKAGLLYQGDIHQADITITQKGVIHLETPIKVSFLDDLSNIKKSQLRHPLEDNIIEDTKMLMGSTEKGQEFLNILQKHKTKIRVIGSPNYMGLSINNDLIYMSMPVVEQTAKYAQAIVLGAHAHDIHQNSEGFTRPSVEVEPTVFIDLNYGKNLDMLLETCIMIDEYEEQNAVGALQEIEAMGLKDFYEARKTEQDMDKLMGLYLQVINKMR